MNTLEVHIFDTRSQITDVMEFHASPIRVGRNAFNDLRINDPSISQWHGVIYFGESGASYMDVGSKNGSFCEGQRLATHERKPVSSQTPIRLGPMQLRCEAGRMSTAAPGAGSLKGGKPKKQWSTEPPTAIASFSAASLSAQAAPTPHATPTERQHPGASTGSKGWAQEVRPSQQGIRSAHPGAPAVPADPAPSGTNAGAASISALSSGDTPHPSARLGGRHEPGTLLFLRPARAQGAASLALHARTLTEGDGRGQDQTRQERADLPAQAPAAEAASEPPAASAAAAPTTASLAMRVREQLGIPLPSTPPQVFETQLIALLQTFAQGYIELRRGYERFEEDMGLAAAGSGPVDRAENSQDLLTALLQCDGNGEAGIYALTRAYADLAMHQLALLHAMSEGARGMLEDMAPDKLRQEAERSADAEGVWAKLAPTSPSRLWATFKKHHADLLEGDHFARRLLGRRFLRAYRTFRGG